MSNKPYTTERSDPATAKANEPEMGETVTLTTAMFGHRRVFSLVAENQWHAEFADRRTALNFARSNTWIVKASALDEGAA
jgi:hypothetical protein